MAGRGRSHHGHSQRDGLIGLKRRDRPFCTMLGAGDAPIRSFAPLREPFFQKTTTDKISRKAAKPQSFGRRPVDRTSKIDTMSPPARRMRVFVRRAVNPKPQLTPFARFPRDA